MKTQTILSAIIEEIRINLGFEENCTEVEQLNNMSINQLEYLKDHYCKYTN
jgi:hypothetical protein